MTPDELKTKKIRRAMILGRITMAILFLFCGGAPWLMIALGAGGAYWVAYAITSLLLVVELAAVGTALKQLGVIQ